MAAATRSGRELFDLRGARVCYSACYSSCYGGGWGCYTGGYGGGYAAPAPSHGCCWFSCCWNKHNYSGCYHNFPAMGCYGGFGGGYAPAVYGSYTPAYVGGMAGPMMMMPGGGLPPERWRCLPER